MKLPVTLLAFLATLSVAAQTTLLFGKVVDEGNLPIPGAVVLDEASQTSALCLSNGQFELNLEEGRHEISISMLGYVTEHITVELGNERKELQVTLKESTHTLGEVQIVGKSELREVEESGFNAIAIDAKPFHNVSVSMTQVLEQASGVKIQQEGGLGSRTNVNINGLSGRHVRFFIDGMPMDAMSSAFQVNNLPLNMAERIEVYKGVVPVNFGSDALGGAINIVTNRAAGKYIDFSYSYGSFNTHQTYLNTGYTADNGFTVQLSAFQNYSDNDYYVDATIKDFNTNLLSREPQRVRRFHDVYHNETVIAKVGVVNKTWADQLLFGFTAGQEYDEIQHPAYLNLAFGEKYQTSTILMPSFLYSKSDVGLDGLDVSLAANYNLGGGHNYDLSDREYNWLGESKPSNSLGEMQYSDYEYKNNNGTINANLNYEINVRHRITLNNVTTLFARQGDEKKAVDDYINQEPRRNNRNILGVSWNTAWNEDFSTSLSTKVYSYEASAFLDLSNTNVSRFETVKKSDTKYGYGLTAAYFLTDELQLKANYELATRLPESAELFGEVFGFYVANFDLLPEQSHNFNVGFNYTHSLPNQQVISADVNGFYRRTYNFIRRNISYSQGEGSFQNTELVLTPGVDAEVRYSLQRILSVGISASYVRPTNYTEGSTFYGATLPNQPTLFGNLNATYFREQSWFGGGRMSIAYNLQFTDEFSYEYDTYQAANGAVVPRQWNHSVFASYSWSSGTYNLSVGCQNIFDANLYDNFSLQKPGRSFSIKFRYFLHAN